MPLLRRFFAECAAAFGAAVSDAAESVDFTPAADGKALTGVTTATKNRTLEKRSCEETLRISFLQKSSAP